MTGDAGYFTPTPKRAPHECRPPMEWSVAGRPPLPAGHEGQSWRCECGKAFVVVSIEEHGESWRSWRRLPEEDPPSHIDLGRGLDPAVSDVRAQETFGPVHKLEVHATRTPEGYVRLWLHEMERDGRTLAIVLDDDQATAVVVEVEAAAPPPPLSCDWCDARGHTINTCPEWAIPDGELVGGDEPPDTEGAP